MEQMTNIQDQLNQILNGQPGELFLQPEPRRRMERWPQLLLWDFWSAFSGLSWSGSWEP